MDSNLSPGISLEPSLSFHNADLKIKWAAEGLNYLNTICEDFIKSKPYVVRSDPDAAGTGQVLHVGLTQPIPPEINLLAGDIVGNLRSALDFAWMGLVRSLAKTGTKPDKLTLPIGNDRKGLKGTIAQSLVGKAFKKQTESLLVDRIKSHRDLADGGNESLVALNDLSNWNKHNLLIITLGQTGFSGSFGGIRHMSNNAFIGNVRGVIRWSGSTGLDLDHDNEPTCQIVFGGHEIVKHKPVIPTLANFCLMCGESLDLFRQEFGRT